jgi:hypothetical protein
LFGTERLSASRRAPPRRRRWKGDARQLWHARASGGLGSGREGGQTPPTNVRRDGQGVRGRGAGARERGEGVREDSFPPSLGTPPMKTHRRSAWQGLHTCRAAPRTRGIEGRRETAAWSRSLSLSAFATQGGERERARREREKRSRVRASRPKRQSGDAETNGGWIGVGVSGREIEEEGSRRDKMRAARRCGALTRALMSGARHPLRPRSQAPRARQTNISHSRQPTPFRQTDVSTTHRSLPSKGSPPRNVAVWRRRRRPGRASKTIVDTTRGDPFRAPHPRRL